MYFVKQCSKKQYPLDEIYSFVHSHHVCLTMYINFKEKYDFGLSATRSDKICHTCTGMNGTAKHIRIYSFVSLHTWFQYQTNAFIALLNFFIYKSEEYKNT